ncbi:MAG: outer membrane beta-barrel protein [Alphaproteobacteria bacterium]|nr:outer membrane beta-barrel protein [Alphaproteobacteria bacterium]
MKFMNFFVQSGSIASRNRPTNIALILMSVGAFGLFSPTSRAATSEFYGLLNLGLSTPITSFSTPDKLGAKYTITPSAAQRADGATSRELTEDEFIDYKLTSKTGFMAEAGAGYNLDRNVAVELGLQYHGYDFSGSTTRTYTGFSYTSKGTGALKSSLTNLAVLPKIRFNYDINDRIDLSVFVGAGLAYNKTSDLTENFNRSDSSGYSSKSTFTTKGASQINFAWTAGWNAGYRITDTIRVGAFLKSNGLGSGVWNKTQTLTAGTYAAGVGATYAYDSAPKVTLLSFDYGASLRMSF